MMTPAEARAEAEQLLAMMRVVMPRASDREIYNAVQGDIRPPPEGAGASRGGLRPGPQDLGRHNRRRPDERAPAARVPRRSLMPDDTTAPATAEGLREQLTEVVTRWALMYPLGNWGIWGTADGASRDQLAGIAEDIAAGWGRDIADRMLAEVAPVLERLRAERDLLRETLAGSDLGAQVLAQWEAIAAADADRDRLEDERDAVVATVRTAQITHIRETHPDRMHVANCLACYVLVPLSRDLPSRPDDPEEIRRLAQATTEETNDG